jgi:16S rRNA (cytosine1402-N4)-methyltransferase
LLAALPAAELLGIDRDPDALVAAAATLAPFTDRVHLVQGTFSEMPRFAKARKWTAVDGILLDLGVSSHQVDTPLRGFSHRTDGPLDMRMDRRGRCTASVLLNQASAAELERIFREYGEEPNARSLAREIVRRRESRPWQRTGELAGLMAELAGRSQQRGLPVATRCFQALRIAVNDELGELERALPAARALLNPGGRLAVISFHSLEDRRVKNYLREESAQCLCPPGLPVCVCGHRPSLRLLTRKPVRPQAEELARNRRAAAARLRAAERI